MAVYQHLRSRREGDDLRGLLASLPHEQQKKAEIIASNRNERGGRVGASIVLAAILLGAPPTALRAAQTPSPTAEAPADSGQQARVLRLSRALDEESQREIYRWHDADHPSPPTWLDKLLSKIRERYQRGVECLREFFSEGCGRAGLLFLPGTKRAPDGG